jgi:hypothetical protein
MILPILTACGYDRNTTSTKHETSTSETVSMYDMYAIASGFEGNVETNHAVIRVDYILTGTAVTLTFSHDQQDHEFTLFPQHYEALKQGEIVVVDTDKVDGHRHEIVIDPNNPQWRVAGALPTKVSIDTPLLIAGKALHESTTPELSDASDLDNDGVENALDLCSYSPYGDRVHQNGPWSGCAAGQVRDADRPD